MPDGGGTLQEIYRLTKENNQMLRAMRSHARWHLIYRLLMFVAIVAALIWFYLNFIGPSLQQMLDALNKIQGASTQAHDQLSSFTNSLEKLRSFIPGGSTAATSTPAQ